jgi:TPP-dependent pyruvate/acetoin dehydrogenase alpha subunit
MRFIRRFEEEVARIYPSDKIKSPVHLSIGQEAVAVGVCDPLRSTDVVSATYRGHAVYLAKGGDAKAMMAELYGKQTGCAAGRGGSMHLIDIGANVLGASAVVGTTIPITTGYAMALKRQQAGNVAVSFFGDGAVEEGVFHESLNFAALHRLPLLFVCENNGYAIHTPLQKRWATTQLCERVATYGIPTCRFASPDVLELRAKTIEIVKSLRDGGGPVFFECLTYRWREHVGPAEDYDAGYRTRAELEPWIAGDELPRLRTKIDSADLALIDAEIEREISDAVQFAETSPFPSSRELYSHVFAN